MNNYNINKTFINNIMSNNQNVLKCINNSWILFYFFFQKINKINKQDDFWKIDFSMKNRQIIWLIFIYCKILKV